MRLGVDKRMEHSCTVSLQVGLGVARARGYDQCAAAGRRGLEFSAWEQRKLGVEQEEAQWPPKVTLHSPTHRVLSGPPSQSLSTL